MDHIHQLAYTSRTVQPIVDAVFSLALANKEDEDWVELAAECSINFKAISLAGERARARARSEDGAKSGEFSLPWIQVDDVQSRLGPKQVMIDVCKIHVSDGLGTDAIRSANVARPLKHIYAAVVIPPIGEQPVVVRIGSAEEIDAEVMRFRRSLRTSGVDLASVSARLVPLFDRFCQHMTSVVISPDGALWQIPWEALALPTGAFILEDWEISYLHTAQDLIRRQDVSLASSETAVVFVADFASPSAPSDKMPSLPNAQREAKAAKSALRQFILGDVDPLTNWTAMQEASSPGVAVVITHAYFDNANDSEELLRRYAGQESLRMPGHYSSIAPPPLEIFAALTSTDIPNPLLRCGILLPSESGVASRRDARQLSQLDLQNTQMVVLSGCESAVGRVDSLMGPLSVREAFHIAGAKAVVGALWQVPDKESADLMEHFWSHVATGESPAAALRKAKLALISQLRSADKPVDPFVWAAFTVTGDDRLLFGRAVNRHDPTKRSIPQTEEVSKELPWLMITLSTSTVVLLLLTLTIRFHIRKRIH